jgi:hypothetical protein
MRFLYVSGMGACGKSMWARDYEIFVAIAEDIGYDPIGTKL